MRSISLIVPVVLATTGCLALQRPPLGSIATPGVEIRAEDGSFAFAAGQDFKPPYYCDCVAKAVTTNYQQAEQFKQAIDRAIGDDQTTQHRRGRMRDAQYRPHSDRLRPGARRRQ